ncbi:unnamed protein product [Phytomonas sp. EM1]|nr:unnamed protein product [Phytomonas sp. EM1]|eukprot:CCW59670.1 unnamed protein product [Phytomonas sp. isolate EM1]
MTYAYIDKPKYYSEGDEIQFWVYPIRSSRSSESKDYYSLPFSAPKEIMSKSRTASEIVRNEEGQSSLYKVKMLVNSKCTFLSDWNTTRNIEDLRMNRKLLADAIEQGYRGYMKLDDLYVFSNGSVPQFDLCTRRPKYNENFPKWGYVLGVSKFCSGVKTYVNNHLHFIIYYKQRRQLREFDEHSDEVKRYMIMGVNVVPYSVKRSDHGTCNSDFDPNSNLLYPADVGDFTGPFWSYSVEWLPFDSWVSHWSAYSQSSLLLTSLRAQLVYISESFVVVLVLCAFMAVGLLRALRRDMMQYNNAPLEALQEETGWRLVHADVSRPPEKAILLSIMVGGGHQVLFTLVAVVLTYLFGAIPPLRKNSMLFSILSLLPLMSLVGGYTCGTLLQYLNLKAWRHVFLLGCGIPGVMLAMCMTKDYIVRRSNSSMTDSSTHMPYFFVLFAVNLFLTILGAFFAFNRTPLKSPTGFSRLEREIPRQPLMNRRFMLYTVPPILPFLAIILEFHYLIYAIWMGQMNYAFGLLALASMIWVVMCALVTIFQLYYLLRHENHRWWWPAFMIPGGMGLHVFVYSIFLCAQLHIKGFFPMLLYFIYMGVVSIGYGLVAGAIGVTAGLFFVRRIYSSITIK